MPQEFARIIAEPFVRTLFATQIFLPCPLHTQDPVIPQPTFFLARNYLIPFLF